MSTALTRNRNRTQRSPAFASGRLRKAAEHYVRNGCKALKPSLMYGGYTENTASEPTKNGLTHDRLVQVASYWNRGAQQTARAHLGQAITRLHQLMNDPAAPAAAQGAAAKTIIDVAAKEAEKDDGFKVAAEEQGKWMSLIKHQKRALLRRGILMGVAACIGQIDGIPEGPVPPGVWKTNGKRTMRLLERLNYLLGKGPCPEEWMEEDGESVLGSEGDPRHGSYVDAEVLEIRQGAGQDEAVHDASDPSESGPSPADPE